MTNHTPIDDLVKNHSQNQGSTQHVGHGPESEPIPSQTIESSSIQEVVEHEITDPEVKEHVEERKETIKLPKELERAGLKTVDTTQFPTYQEVKLPMSDDKIMDNLKQPINKSVRWLATFYTLILAQSHIALKKIGGKVVRVLKK
jgi:hypothetical protein